MATLLHFGTSMLRSMQLVLRYPLGNALTVQLSHACLGTNVSLCMWSNFDRQSLHGTGESNGSAMPRYHGAGGDTIFLFSANMRRYACAQDLGRFKLFVAFYT